jgi:hypothetical protein
VAISISFEYGRFGLHVTYSKSSPSGLDVPVRRACFPSTLSMVEYLEGRLAPSQGCAKGVNIHPHAKREAVVHP